MKTVIAMLATLLLLGIVSAANESGLDSFDDMTVFAPPILPASASNQLAVTFKDTTTKEPISDVHVSMVFVDANGQEQRSMSYMEGTTLQLSIPQEVSAHFYIDRLDTTGSDYYAQVQLSPESQNTSIFALPTGSVRGRVLSDDKVVSGAVMNFVCTSSYMGVQQTTTDSYGAYSRMYLPIGSCTISANHNNRVGHSTVEITQGALIEVDILLNTKRDVSSNLTYFIVALALIILGIIIFHFSKRVKTSTTKTVVKEDKPHRRTEDIIQTLQARERKIVEYLLEHNNEATQGQLKNGTGIPKTSLARIFVSLESKKVISIEKIGKMKKAHLTDFFLGKE